MPLSAGTQLGPYEVVEPLGELDAGAHVSGWAVVEHQRGASAADGLDEGRLDLETHISRDRNARSVIVIDAQAGHRKGPGGGNPVRR